MLAVAYGFLLDRMPGRKGRGREPGMVWKIARKDFLLNVMTFKFAVATAACVVLAAVFTPILAKEYEQRLGAYRDNVARNAAELRKVKVYMNIVPTVFRPPSVLSVFSEGREKRIGDSSAIELDGIPEIRAAATQSNPYQSIFPAFDVSLIFRVVLSVLALLVAYDAISGEREQGTLKLMLAGTARRHQMLLAKLLAGLFVLSVPITMTFIVVLILLLSFPMVDLTRPEWARIGLMYLASLIFASAMYNLGLLLSCLTRKSGIALVLGIFAWVVFVVVVPNGSVYLAVELRPLEPQERHTERIMALEREYQDELSAGHPPQDLDIERAQSDTAGAFGRSYHRLLNESAMIYFLRDYEVVCTLGDRYANEFWRVEQSRLNTLFAQDNLARRLSRISPVSWYGGVMSTLAGTDVARYQSFAMAVRTYRNRIVDYVRSKTDNFTSPRLFTPYTLEEMERLPEGAEASSLDLRDLPQFTFHVHDTEELRGALCDLAVLVLASLLFFSLSLVLFMKYDAR
jgi:ABC-type transport system involved in multi-copper enzyme maturation permease subunit